MYIPTPYLAFLALVATKAIAYPNPEPCTGNCSAIHDPSVIQRKSDGTWYRFNTNGNIGIASAPNLTGPWTYDGELLEGGSVIEVSASQGVWVCDSPASSVFGFCVDKTLMSDRPLMCRMWMGHTTLTTPFPPPDPKTRILVSRLLNCWMQALGLIMGVSVSPTPQPTTASTQISSANPITPLRIPFSDQVGMASSKRNCRVGF